MGDNNHYLGPLNGQEMMLLMPNVRRSGSVALSLLGHYGDLGVIIFNSRDSQHFQEGMGTAMLDKLAQILPELLTRWIAKTMSQIIDVPETLSLAIDSFLSYIEVERRLSPVTVENYQRQLMTIAQMMVAIKNQPMVVTRKPTCAYVIG